MVELCYYVFYLLQWYMYIAYYRLCCYFIYALYFSQLSILASGFTDEELAECLSRVDMKQCSIKALRHAQQSEGIPAAVLLTATLDLCEALMEKNEASSKVIQV